MGMVDLETRCFPDPMSLNFFSKLWDQDVYHFRIIKKSDRIIAHVVYMIVAEEMELVTIAVDELFRNRGLGKALLENAFADAREAGVNDCFLYVRHDNEFAKRLYAGFGFEEVGVVKKYYQKKNDAIVMRTKV